MINLIEDDLKIYLTSPYSTHFVIEKIKYLIENNKIYFIHLVTQIYNYVPFVISLINIFSTCFDFSFLRKRQSVIHFVYLIFKTKLLLGNYYSFFTFVSALHLISTCMRISRSVIKTIFKFCFWVEGSLLYTSFILFFKK